MVDLSIARDAARWTMTSTCRIERDAEGTSDDTLDPATLQLTRPVGEPTTVYEGPCMVRRADQSLDAVGRDGEVETGGETRERPGYDVSLPHDAALPQRNDIVVVLACTDSALVNQRLQVEEVRRTQWLVRRSLFAVAT